MGNASVEKLNYLAEWNLHCGEKVRNCCKLKSSSWICKPIALLHSSVLVFLVGRAVISMHENCSRSSWAQPWYLQGLLWQSAACLKWGPYHIGQPVTVGENLAVWATAGIITLQGHLCIECKHMCTHADINRRKNELYLWSSRFERGGGCDCSCCRGWSWFSFFSAFCRH